MCIEFCLKRIQIILLCIMSNKKIILPKTKFQNTQPIKTSNSGIFNEPKSQLYFTSKNQNINKELPKFKGNAIYRHASEEQFKRYHGVPINGQNTTDNIVSAEEEYYQKQQNFSSTYHNNYKKTNTVETLTLSKKLLPSHINSQKVIGDPYPGRNYLKQTSSTSSMDHNPPRRVSPGSTPNLFKPHPKLKIRQSHPQRLTRDNFKLIKKLGQGKFGKVYLVREIATGFVMAMKVVEKKKIIQDNILEQFTRQLKIQAFLNHPNIIDLYGFFDDELYFYTLMEVGCDGQLYSLISQQKNLTEEATSFITKNLLQAVNCMHENKILHRDIKPENIVLIMGNVKMCDFGWAVNKIKKQELRSTFCGTPLYLSPQILKGYKYDEKVDLWAIGILAYELLFGCSPFDINQQQDLYKILTEQVRFPKNKKVTNEFQQFIRCILNKNPKQRLPSHELLRMHFIRKYEQFETCEQLCS